MEKEYSLGYNRDWAYIGTSSKGGLDEKETWKNQGSVYQRSSDKRWVGQVTIQKKHYMKYFSTQREAETWLRQVLLKIGQGIPLAGTQASIEEYFTS